MRFPRLQFGSGHSDALLAILRYAATAVIVVSTVLFLAALPARFVFLHQQVEAARSVLVQFGFLNEVGLLAATFFAPTALLFEFVVMGLYLLNALLIIRLRSQDWQALITAAGLATFALHITPTLNTWMSDYPDLAWIGIVMKSIGLGLAFLFLYLVPGGYFAPSWMRYFIYAWVVWSALWIIFPGSIFDFRDPYLISGGGAVALMAWWLLGVFTQVYRYRYASSIVEKQQSKFIFYGATFVILGYTLYVPLRDYMRAMPQPEIAATLYGLFAPYAFLAMVMIIPVTITFSILRYRLFDIDLIIRKTLVYAGLTGLLAILYFSSVVLLQTIFSTTGETRSPTAVVLSTLGIAALFNPLRRRLQYGIDRRFYRSKYDAEVALARFEERMRNEVEVDLDRLCAHLADVIGETVQPKEVNIWLGPTHFPGESQSGAEA